MKIEIRSHKLLNKQEFSSALLANCLGNFDRKYGNYLS